MERFRSTLEIVSGGFLTLSPADFMAINAADKHTDVSYRVVQRASNGVRLVRNSNATELAAVAAVSSSSSSSAAAMQPIDEFTQRDIDNARVHLEHSPQTTDDKHEALVLSIGDAHLRVLVVRIEPLALRLVNFSDIRLTQGRTFVVLTRCVSVKVWRSSHKKTATRARARQFAVSILAPTRTAIARMSFLM